MAIHSYHSRILFNIKAPVIAKSPHGGVFVASLYAAQQSSGLTILYVCDTPAEAEEMRQLLERHREEVEALLRKWEG